jgi:glutaryl-CoA dehydrogenase
MLPAARRLAALLGCLNEARHPVEISLESSTTSARRSTSRICRTVLGGSGIIILEYPVLRHASNLESVFNNEGTSEMHQLAIGQALTGISAYR